MVNVEGWSGLYPSPVKSLQAVTKLFFVLRAFGFTDLSINIHFDNILHIQLLYCLPPPSWFWFDDFTTFDLNL